MERRILIVDDDENFLDFVVRALEKSRYRLTTATTPDRALESARRDPPDLLLLDIGLPGLDGFDLCEILSGDGIPILIVSGHPYRQEKLRTEYSGAVGYVQKPVKPAELRDAVKKALRQPRTTKRSSDARASGGG